MIRIVLPAHLQSLAGAPREVTVEIPCAGGWGALIDALELRYPPLRGAIRQHGSARRRPLVRFFACEEDWSHEPPDKPLPEPILTGKDPFFIVGAIAGG